jgi:hypothetical protein
MKMLFGFCCVVALACMAFASPALAFAGPVGGSALIDIAPVVTAFVQIVAAVLAALVSKFFHDGHVRAYLNRILELSVQYAIEAVHNLDWTKLETRNELIALAANYVIRSAPGALKKFGIDRLHLEDMVLARLHFHDPETGAWRSGDAPEDELEAARRRGRGQSSLEVVPT